MNVANDEMPLLANPSNKARKRVKPIYERYHQYTINQNHIAEQLAHFYERLNIGVSVLRASEIQTEKTAEERDNCRQVRERYKNSVVHFFIYSLSL